MTYFLDFRHWHVGGSAVSPRLREFVAHGFNVSRPVGAFSIGTLDNYLALTDPNILVGVLWPGDSWIPVVDYPFEGSVAIATGRFLAAFCNRWCVNAQSLSFVSHSLGARVVLEAIANLDRKRVRSVCLTAAAINRDCLTQEYATATTIADRISILASDNDVVLRIAYSIGDPFADLLHTDHTAFKAALGYRGPPLPALPPIAPPWQIPEVPAYGHGNYLPKMPAADELWHQPADFMRRAFLGLSQTWPSA